MLPLRHLLVIILFPLTALAADLESALRDTYKSRTLLIRGFYQDEFLHYDSAGTLLSKSAAGPWTTSLMRVDSIQWTGEVWQLVGRRTTVIFSLGQFKNVPTQRKLRIQVDAPDRSDEAIRAALARIFVSPYEPLQTLVPEYWTSVVEHLTRDGKFDLSPEEKPDKSKPACPEVPSVDSPCLGARGIKAPKLNQSTEPAYLAMARELGVIGTTVLWLVVDEQGHPQRIRVLRPLGVGLDDEAVATVRQWTFHPGERAGKPVAVQVNVEVNFAVRLTGMTRLVCGN